MKREPISIFLIIVMVVCFAVALSYPLRYSFQKSSNETTMDDLRAMRESALEDSADSTRIPSDEAAKSPIDDEDVVSEASAPVSTGAAVADGINPQEDHADTTPDPGMNNSADSEDNAAGTDSEATVAAQPSKAPGGDAAKNGVTGPEETPAVQATATEEPIDRYHRENDALPYPNKERIELDPEKILPQYQQMYEQNPDLVGWLNIPGTPIDYPVLQNEVRDYYLKKDFYGNKNFNGQLILDSACDPWTPSYNLVVSGHNMNSGKMFGSLEYYTSKYFWQKHKTFTYDSLMREGTYVVFAAFYSADYDVDETGFRYNADIQYGLDAELWLGEVAANQLYDTGIDVKFGDEILTLTTCFYQRKDGRFVVVARRVREGEVIE